MIRDHNLTVLGGTIATRLNLEPGSGRIASLETSDVASGRAERINDVDAVVLAVGAKGLRALMTHSPDCAAAAPELVVAGSLDAIDVVSVRLWLDRTVAVDDPANVFSRFEALRGSGATFFMLDQLQDGSLDALWGGEEPQGSVIASDFYNASAIAELSDQAIVDTLMHDLLPVANSAFRDAQVVDSEVRRYPASVSLFSPGSATKRPSGDVSGCSGLRR